MSKLTRLPVKWVRDYIKKDYKLKDCCYIFADNKDLELHHLYSVSELFTKWCSKQNITTIIDDEHIKTLRVIFYKDCYQELSHDNLYTLCSEHHKRLHNIYGQTYPNTMAVKIKNWIEIQRGKYNCSE